MTTGTSTTATLAMEATLSAQTDIRGAATNPNTIANSNHSHSKPVTKSAYNSTPETEPSNLRNKTAIRHIV